MESWVRLRRWLCAAVLAGARVVALCWAQTRVREHARDQGVTRQGWCGVMVHCSDLATARLRCGWSISRARPCVPRRV